jgi:hypothetical protein
MLEEGVSLAFGARLYVRATMKNRSMARRLKCARVHPREVITIESNCLGLGMRRAMVSSFGV